MFCLFWSVDNQLPKHHFPQIKVSLFIYQNLKCKETYFKIPCYARQIIFPRMVSTKTVKVNISYWDSAVKENLHYILIVLFHLEKYTS